MKRKEPEVVFMNEISVDRIFDAWARAAAGGDEYEVVGNERKEGRGWDRAAENGIGA